jgi:hypothetical protein
VNRPFGHQQEDEGGQMAVLPFLFQGHADLSYLISMNTGVSFAMSSFHE